MNLNLKIPYVLRLIIFWLAFFIAFRILFVIYQHARIPDGGHSETGRGFYYAFPVDLSAACVMSFIPFILWICQQFYKTRLIHRINLIYNFGLIIFTSLLSVTNIKMYGEWGDLLSFGMLKELFNPQRTHSFSLWSVLLLFSFSGLFAYIGIRFYRNYITNFSFPLESKQLRAFHIIGISLMFFVGYRIALNVAAIKDDRIHYSELEINNHIATNNMWYFANSVVYCNNPQK